MTAQTGSPTRPPLQSCPICALAMIARKSRPDSKAFDIYECLSCDTELRFASRPAHPDR
jgi:hypothetical protein